MNFTKCKIRRETVMKVCHTQNSPHLQINVKECLYSACKWNIYAKSLSHSCHVRTGPFSWVYIDESEFYLNDSACPNLHNPRPFTPQNRHLFKIKATLCIFGKRYQYTNFTQHSKWQILVLIWARWKRVHICPTVMFDLVTLSKDVAGDFSFSL